jgi:hypothetical protein
MGVCLPVCLPDSVYMSFCLSVWLSVCLFVRMTICLSLFLSICLTLCLSLFLSVWLSICMSVCPFVSLYVCLPVCLSLSPFIFPVLDLEARMWTRVMLYLFCIWIMGLLAPGPGFNVGRFYIWILWILYQLRLYPTSTIDVRILVLCRHSPSTDYT